MTCHQENVRRIATLEGLEGIASQERFEEARINPGMLVILHCERNGEAELSDTEWSTQDPASERESEDDGSGVTSLVSGQPTWVVYQTFK